MSMVRDLVALDALTTPTIPGDVAEPGRHEVGLHVTCPSMPGLRLVGSDDDAANTVRAMWSTAPAGSSSSATSTSRGAGAEHFARLGHSP